MDKITIKGLEIYAYHGVFPEEKREGQKFYINANLYCDLSKPAATDHLEDSTHYGLVCEQITKSMTEKSYDLIEKVAGIVAKDILLHFPLVKGVEIEVQKPEAPIGLPFETVSVTLEKGWHRVYVAFGSNLGEREKLIQEALDEIKAQDFVRDMVISSFVISKPYGGVEQGDFVNGVCGFDTFLTPWELLEFLQSLEQKAHRERLVHWGPRTLDLDILFYEDLILDSQDLVIPHKDMKNRDFVLTPLKEIAPFFRHPITKKTVEEMETELVHRNTQEGTYIYGTV